MIIRFFKNIHYRRLDSKSFFSLDFFLLFFTSLILVIFGAVYFGRVVLDHADETHIYMGAGNRFFSRMIISYSAEWSPIYSYWYYFLSLFENNPISLARINHFVIPILTLFVWMFFLVRVGISLVVSSLIVLITASHPFFWSWHTKVHQFNVLCCVLYLALIYKKSVQSAFVISLPAFVILSLVRPENMILLPAVVFIYVFYIVFSKSKKNSSEILRFFSVAVFSFVTTRFLGLGSDDKAWSTYYMKQWERLSGKENFPFHSPLELANALFPNSKNILSAIFANPKVFFENLIFQLNALIEQTLDFYQIYFDVNFSTSLVVIAFFLLGIFLAIKNRKKLKGNLFLIFSFVFLLFPLFSMVLLYGSLQRYLIPIFVVLPCLFLFSLNFLNRKKQLIIWLIFIVTISMQLPAWARYKKHLEHDAGMNYEYEPLVSQLQQMIFKKDIRILSDCGSIGALFSPETSFDNATLQIFQSEYPTEVAKSTQEIFRLFDLFIDCPQFSEAYAPMDEFKKRLLFGIKQNHKGYDVYQFFPSRARAYIKQEILTGKIPLGVLRSNE